jgi:4-amino-4-deoxy-L-arabinose transferase-like glycosyltransferase
MYKDFATKDAKSQVDKKPSQKVPSRVNLPPSLIFSFVLSLLSLVSLLYYFLKGSKSKPRQPYFNSTGSIAPDQLDQNITKDTSNFDTSAEKIEQLKQKGNLKTKWFEPSNSWSFPNLFLEKTKKIVSSAAGPLGGLVIAYFAQGVFDSTDGRGALQNWIWLNNMSIPTRLWLGAGGFLISMLIWIFATPVIHSVGQIINPPEHVNSINPRYPPIRLFLLLSGIGVYCALVILFLIRGENALIRILWVAGLLCFILSQVPLPGIRTLRHHHAEESPRFHWQNWLVLALILGAAFWLRFYKLATIPADFHGDMGSHGSVARDFLLGVEKNIFGFSSFYDIPSMAFLPATFTMAVFGDNIFGLQMSSVIGGVLSLFATYLLVWRLFDSHRLAVLTMALVAINVAAIHFSRIAEYMDPWTFGIFALFFLIDGLKARRFASLGLAGVFLGFSLQMYYSGRVLIFIIVIFLLYAFFFQRLWITENKRGLLIMVAGTLLAMGPALASDLMHWGNVISRSQEVFIFSPDVLDHLLNKYNTNSVFVVLLTQIKLTLLMFNQTSDTSSQFGFPFPMFSSLISPLIMLGLGFAIKRWKDAGIAFVLIWLGLMAVLGSILTSDAPSWPRLVGIVPAAAVLIALALDQIIELWKKYMGAHAVASISALIVILLAVVGYLNWDQYYSYVNNNASVTTVTGRYIGRLPADFTACGILTGPPLSVRETAFLAWPHKLVDISPDAPDSALNTCIGSSIVWVISPENLDRLDAIRNRWPNGIVQNYHFPNFNYTLTFYLVGVLPIAYQPATVSNQLAWISAHLTTIFIFILYGLMIWLFFNILYQRIKQDRQVRIKAGSSNIDNEKHISRHPALIISLRNSIPEAYRWINNWYHEVITFKFPRVSLKILVPTILSLVAVGLAYFAQTFLDQQKDIGLHLPIAWLNIASENLRLEIACLIFLIAGLLWTFTTIVKKKDQSQGLNLKQAPTESTSARIREVFGRITFSPMQIVSIFFTISAILFYVAFGENSLVRWLWLAGLIFFLAALFVKNNFDGVKLREKSPVFRWYHVLLLLCLLILAFFLRVYRLNVIPFDLSTDMASYGISAREYLLGTEQRIFGTGWYYMPRITFLPYVLSMAVAGNNLFGLYFATVIMGTLNILGVYLLIWRLFDSHRLAFLTAVLVTINPAHIEYSRIAGYMDPWFLGYFGLFFFANGLKGRGKISFAIAGLFFGFTLVNYPSGRAIIPMILITLVCAWSFKRRWVTDNYNGLAWMTLGILTALGPDLVYMITNWSVYMQRTSEVLISNPGNIEHLKFTYQVNSVWMVVWEQVKRSVLLFNYYTDRSAQFGYPHPMFNSLVSPMLILGFGTCLYRWKKPEYLFVIASFVFILITGSILTDDAPTWCRLVGLIPLAALLIALVFNETIEIFNRASLKPLIPLLLLGIVLYLGVLGVMDWNTYIREVENQTRPVVRVARYLNSLPADINACGITDDYQITQEEIRFLGWPRSLVVVSPDTAEITPDICPGENLVWILSPAYQNRLSEIKAEWPSGIVENHMVNNQLVFISYLVSSNKPNP